MTHDCSEWESICSCHLSVAAGAHELCASFFFFSACCLLCLTVPGAGGWRAAARPGAGHVRPQLPAAGGDDGQPEQQPGDQAGAAGRPPRQGDVQLRAGPPGQKWTKLILLFFHLPQLCFINTIAERQPRLRRQRCIFTKERGQHNNQSSLP